DPFAPHRGQPANVKAEYPIAPIGMRFAAAILTLVVPGAGHILLGKTLRGIIYFLCVLAMFGFGLLLQGHIFTFSNSPDWLSRFFAIFNMGLGVPYLIFWATGWFTQAVSIAPSFEYGNTFLMVSGLLNYLIMLDAFDIGAGRKA